MALTDTQIRKKVRISRDAIMKQIEEYATSLAEFSVKTIKASQQDSLSVGGKPAALTALSQELQVRFALIEFIEALDIDGKNRGRQMCTVLKEHHTRIATGLRHSLVDLSARTTRMQQTQTQFREKGKPLPFGEKTRKDLTGDHVRLMKDLAVLAFIQHLGVSSQSANRPDL